MAGGYAVGSLPRRAGPGDSCSVAHEWRHQFVTDAEFDPTLCLVASNADGILGVAQCWTSAFIKNLAIHPCAQGQGLGRALLLHCFQVFKQRGEPYVDLKVLESNLRARKLYESAEMRFVLRDVVAAD
jgi:ribosomal protein S18 acetylase RimI-like enzyme